ncbi:hypothetical protein FRC02_011819 [Tulasnella sp. 418]|nr:hypothetical protein FRC02_011819 [Tulasnella sp. 418]
MSSIQNSQGWDPLLSYSDVWGPRKSSSESTSPTTAHPGSNFVNRNTILDHRSQNAATHEGLSQQPKGVGTIGDRRHPSASPHSTSDSERTAVEMNHTEMLLRSLSMTPDLDSSYLNRGMPKENAPMTNAPTFSHGIRSFPSMSLPLIQPLSGADPAFLNSPSVISSSSQLTTPSSDYHNLPVATPQEVPSLPNSASNYFDLMHGQLQEPRAVGSLPASTSGGFEVDSSYSSSESSNLSGLGLSLDALEAAKLSGGFAKGPDGARPGVAGGPIHRKENEPVHPHQPTSRPSAPDAHPSNLPSAPAPNANPPFAPQPRFGAHPQALHIQDRIDLQIQARLAELERERGNLMAFQRLRNRPAQSNATPLQGGHPEAQQSHTNIPLQDPAHAFNNSNSMLRLPSDNPLLASLGLRTQSVMPPAQGLPHRRSATDFTPHYNTSLQHPAGSRTAPPNVFHSPFVGGDQNNANAGVIAPTTNNLATSTTSNPSQSVDRFWENVAQPRPNPAVSSMPSASQSNVTSSPGSTNRQVSPQASIASTDDAARTDIKSTNTTEPINYIPLLQPSSRPPYAQLVNRIIRQSDQQASIFIQQKLKSCNGSNPGDEEERGLILDAIMERSFEMMTNRFGNWAYQRCLEAPCTPKERRHVADAMRGRVVELATNCYGTHVVQKALECEEDVRLIILSELLLGDPARTLINKHASHVWSRIMELTWSPPAPPIFTYVNKALKGRWVELATHETGSLVVQHLFENCVEEDTVDCLEEIFAGFDTVVRDQWGSFVIQHLIENGQPEHRTRVLQLLGNNLYQYASDPQAMKSIEKALKVCKEEAMETIVGRLCGLGQSGRRAMIVDLALNANGSQLIAQILPLANEDQRKNLSNAIKRHIVTLKGNKAGSKIVWLFERMRITNDG